jgi:hypothetical protein
MMGESTINAIADTKMSNKRLVASSMALSGRTVPSSPAQRFETAAGNFTDMTRRTLFRAIPFETVEFSIIGAFPRTTTYLSWTDGRKLPVKTTQGQQLYAHQRDSNTPDNR